MKTHDLIEPGEASANPEGIVPRKNPIWREALMRRVGRLVLAVCPKGRTVCENVHCALRPLCACAQADLAAARKFENRVWVAVAICGALVLLLALLRAFF